jgi:hypothetical protein
MLGDQARHDKISKYKEKLDQQTNQPLLLNKKRTPQNQKNHIGR